MKRYSFKSDSDYACSCHRVEDSDGNLLLYSEVKERIEALVRLSQYVEHSYNCEKNTPSHKENKCTCGLDAARTAARM